MRVCKYCGFMVMDETVICPNCGKAIPYDVIMAEIDHKTEKLDSISAEKEVSYNSEIKSVETLQISNDYSYTETNSAGVSEKTDSETSRPFLKMGKICIVIGLLVLLFFNPRKIALRQAPHGTSRIYNGGTYGNLYKTYVVHDVVDKGDSYLIYYYVTTSASTGNMLKPTAAVNQSALQSVSIKKDYSGMVLGIGFLIAGGAIMVYKQKE